MSNARSSFVIDGQELHCNFDIFGNEGEEIIDNLEIEALGDEDTEVAFELKGAARYWTAEQSHAVFEWLQDIHGKTIESPRKYKLCDWERNGYNDSDFYGMYYDEADGQIHTIELGTTRFACSTYHFTAEFLVPTPAILEKSRIVLRDAIFRSLRDAEDCNVLEPGPNAISRGTEVRMLKDHKFMVKEKALQPCFKCDGTGKWNGTNKECFTCHGKGELFFKTKKAIKGEDGKAIRVTIPKDAVLICATESEYFGTFYANGYKTKGRHNASFKTAFTDKDGTRHNIRLALEKVRLNKEPLSDAVIMHKAESLSHHHNYGAIGGCTAWLSNNWALAVAKSQQVAA